MTASGPHGSGKTHLEGVDELLGVVADVALHHLHALGREGLGLGTLGVAGQPAYPPLAAAQECVHHAAALTTRSSVLLCQYLDISSHCPYIELNCWAG